MHHCEYIRVTAHDAITLDSDCQTFCGQVHLKMILNSPHHNPNT